MAKSTEKSVHAISQTKNWGLAVLSSRRIEVLYKIFYETFTTSWGFLGGVIIRATWLCYFNELSPGR